MSADQRKLANSWCERNAHVTTENGQRKTDHVTTENGKQKTENGSPPLPLDLVLRLWDLIGEGIENPLEQLLVRSPDPDLDLRGLRDLETLLCDLGTEKTAAPDEDLEAVKTVALDILLCY